LTVPTAVLLFVAAAIGGAINAVAGGGSFVCFPALLLVGVPPIAANATNTIALWPGTVASAVAYRRELEDVRRELIALGIASLAGSWVGATLLLETSNRAFVLFVPWLLLFATLVFSFGGAIGRRLVRGAPAPLGLAIVVQSAIAVYGGYFGGGMGIMMLAVLSLLGMSELHRMNALKTVLATVINGVAVVVFIAAHAVAWTPGLVMVVGGIAGGYGGAAMARRVEPRNVRRLVLAIAWTITLYFFAKTYALV
jgi:uncharacterized membrane protein YfcA